MNLNKFSQAKSEFSHAVRMFRNHIAEEHFISKFILSVSNSHERLGEAMARFDVKCQICRHASSPCFKAVGASPKLYSIVHKSMCIMILEPFLNFSQLWKLYRIISCQLWYYHHLIHQIFTGCSPIFLIFSQNRPYIPNMHAWQARQLAHAEVLDQWDCFFIKHYQMWWHLKLGMKQTFWLFSPLKMA